MTSKILAVFAVVTMAVFIVVITAWFDMIFSNAIYLLLLPLIISLFHLTTPPTFRLVGIYKYLSPMLLVNIPTKKKYELHNGTSFDYLLNITRMKESSVKRILLIDYLKGLLTIVEEIQLGKLPDTVIVQGSSYFFSERTANRFGFKIEKATVNERLNAMLNYLDLIWMYSIASKKWSFPNLKNMKAAKITGSDLVKNKEKIEIVLERIEKTVAKNGYI